MYKLNLFIKRCFDIISCLIAVILLTPVWIIVAIAIKLDSKGPVLFKQGRRTKDGRVFQMLKFRSMVVNAENLGTGLFSYDNDPRVTPIGHYLRKLSLDELPQLINVLKGDMSFIGPRPKLYKEGRLDHETDENIIKSFSVKPGITGYAQAYFRNSITQDEKFKWDAYYADNVSFLMDVKIIWQTLISVLGRKNVNTVQSQKGE